MTPSKFTVLKNDDIARLPARYSQAIQYAGLCIRTIRYEEGRDADPLYIVINRDEPYVQEIIDIMKKHGHWDEEENK